jgi:hypothetical protein
MTQRGPGSDCGPSPGFSRPSFFPPLQIGQTESPLTFAVDLPTPSERKALAVHDAIALTSFHGSLR